MPKVVPIRPKPKPKGISISFEDRVKVLIFEFTKIVNEFIILGTGDDSRDRHFRVHRKVKTPCILKVCVPRGGRYT